MFINELSFHGSRGVTVLRKIVRYYTAGHTAKGFVNYLSSNIRGMDQVIILRHISNEVKTMILNKLSHYFAGKFDLEQILSPNGKDYLEGLIIPELFLGIITDVIASEKIDAQVFDLEGFFPTPKKSKDIVKAVSKDFQAAYDHLSKALLIHDDLESIYINEMDFKQADQLAEEFLEKNLGHMQGTNEPSVKKFRLFGTNTPDGQVNIVPELLEGVQSSFYLKGRAGTGKSTFMRRVIKECEKLGLDMEIYHCSFDPDSVDMVLVPEADFCIFDSTNPHEFFPEGERGQIIDLYEQTVKAGTDERFAEEIKSVTNKYRAEVTVAMDFLKEAGRQQLELEEEYYDLDENIGPIVKEILEKVRK